MSDQSFGFKILGKTPVIMIEGELAAAAHLDLIKTYDKIKTDLNPDSLALNFSGITYINSSGIASLIDIIHDMKSRNGVVSFICLSDHLRDRMDYLGLLEFVKVYQTNEELIEQS